MESFSEAGTIIANNKWQCYDEDGNFDWDAYQELCDTADEWSDEK